MPAPNPRTIAEAIDACRQRLRDTSTTPWLDARLLAQHVTGLDASAVIAYGDATLDSRRRHRLLELTERRAAGEPVAYIIGHKAFCGLEIAIDRRALVPRPETEELASMCATQWSGRQVRIAEPGTGSGAIACALAHLLPGASITAGDKSEDALELAAYNVTELGFSEQVRLVHSDLLAQFPNQRCDVIIANLPYVASAAMARLDVTVREYEPELALAGGHDGLDVYRRLLEQAPARLAHDGALYLECGPDNARTLSQLVGDAFPRGQTRVNKDLAGLDRIVTCHLGEGRT